MFALLVPARASAAGTTQIIVKREPGLSAAEQRSVRSDAGATLVERLSVPGLEVVEVPSAEAGAALARLNRDPDVAVAELDSTVHEFDHGQPDPAIDELWGFANAGAPTQKAYDIDADNHLVPYSAVADADMNITDAWGLSEGYGRLVAVVDGGVQATQPDLVDRLAPGYDWVDEDTSPDDPHGHGTHVTGTIAANANNGIGVAGVAPKARILPLRVLDEKGSGKVSDIVEAFHLAGQQHVRVVNASFGAGKLVQTEYDEIEKWPDTLFVTAAGNLGEDNDDPAKAKYPCAFDLPNVICVGASDARDERASWSNYGANSVDVFAPGVGILSTWINGSGYAYSSGTSMAAPHIAGLAALLLASNPTLTTAQIKEAIVNTADAKPGLTSVSGGRANATRALAYWPADRDADQVVDEDDNCKDIANDQTDTDGDGVGDVCDDDLAPPVSDADNDGLLDDGADQCPQESGPAETQGCPGLAADDNNDGVLDIFDTDSDHVSDNADNCPAVANNQADADGDKVGDACDSTPRGPDADHDGKPLLDDACPTVYGTLPNGCPKPVVKPKPKPTPTPQPAPADRDHDGRLDRVDSCPTEPAATPNGCPLAYVTALSTKGRKRAATITVRTSRAGTVQITVQRKKGHRWVMVTRRVRLASGKRVTLKLKHLRKGSYRAVIVVSSSAGRAAATTKRFRVR